MQRKNRLCFTLSEGRAREGKGKKKARGTEHMFAFLPMCERPRSLRPEGMGEEKRGPAFSYHKALESAEKKRKNAGQCDIQKKPTRGKKNRLFSLPPAHGRRERAL